MVKSKQVRKMKLSIPKYVPDATLDLQVVGINVVIEDNYNVSSPITIIDKTFTLQSLTYNQNTDKYETILETEIDVESGMLLKYRYCMDKISSPTNNPDLYAYTSFSVPTSFYGNQNGLKVEGLLVLTPRLTVEEKIGTLSGDLLVVNGSDFSMPLGTSKHRSTSWKVYEVNDTNNIIYSRKDDNNNLTSLKLPLSKFDNTKLYVIECSYLSEDNVESLTARYYYNRTRRVKDNIKIEPILPFSEDNDMYYNVSCNVLNAKYINIVIKEKTGNNEIVVASYRNNPIDVYLKLVPNNLKPGLVYNVYYTLTISEGGVESTTSEEFIHSFTYVDNNFYNDAKVNYPEKYDAMYPLQTGNFRCVSYQLKNGAFLLGKNLDNTLTLFIKDGDTLRDTGVNVDLPNHNEKGFPDFIVLQLDDGRVMINYSIFTDDFRKSCWALFDVNLSTNEFTLVDSVIYEDEYLSCGHNGSAVSVGNDIYYIPHKIVSDVDGKRTSTQLKLFKLTYNGSLNREELVGEINEKVFEGYSITYKNGFIYIFGGYDTDRSYIFPDVLKYDIENRSLSTLCLLNNTSNYSRKNSVSVFARPDGKLIMFNNSLDGGDVNDCSTVLFDLSKAGQNGFATIENNDMNINIPFLSTVVLRNGGYIRLSYNDQTMKHVLYYPPTPLLGYDDYDATVSSTLIVRKFETIKVMDLSRYSKIVIEGDSLDNTGKLIYEDEFCTREFDFRTKFVTRNEAQSQVDERNEDKEHIFILQGVNYEVDV